MNAEPGPERKRLRQVPPGRHPMLHRIFRADPLTVREALGYLLLDDMMPGRMIA